MTLTLTPLDVGALSTAAQRALGAGPGRTMAARGLMPLPPADQVTVLYQLSFDSDATVAGTARITAAQLPDKLLSGTLADPAIDPRVLDYFGQMAVERPVVFDAIVLNVATADATIAALAGRCGAREVDLIAQNEQRLLRHPEIVGAMYMNRRARMSTIDRIVELAVRNNVRIPGLAAWDEISRALTGTPPSTAADDATFAVAADKLTGDDSQLTTGDAEEVLPEDAPTPEVDLDDVPINELSTPQKIRLAQLGNAFARGALIRDPLRLIAMAAIKSPAVTEIEAARYAGNPALNEDVIRFIAQKREWTRLYGIKVSLCRNPKTPVAESARMLPFLREKHLIDLSKSKGVPSALVAQARKLMSQRRGGK